MKVVAISGGFDPPHDEHYQYIEEALKLGDYLLVILTRDDQLAQKKGKPWLAYSQRLYMLDFLLQGKKIPYRIVPNVDGDLTAKESLRRYLPIHIFAKGGNTWNEDNLPERDVCKELGIKIEFGVGGYGFRGSSEIKDTEKEKL